MEPKSKADLLHSVIYYGGFLSTYTQLMDFVKQDGSSTAILRGNAGSGKKTLINAVFNNYNKPLMKPQSTKYDTNLKSAKKSQRNSQRKSEAVDFKTKVVPTKELKMIYLNPFHYTDDFQSIKRIATELDINCGSSFDELIQKIETRDNVPFKGKILIVLYYFEEFSRRNQSLLYNLTYLCQHGKDIKLLGVTQSLESTNHLEKRVRSRLNALFFNLPLPYQNGQQFIEFASKLLGDHPIEGKLYSRLKSMYNTEKRNLLDLKRLLCSVCEWDIKTGQLKVNEPDFDENNMRYVDHWLRTMFGSLVKPQKDLFVLACYYCKTNGESESFSTRDLNEFAHNNHISTFDPTSEDWLTHAEILECVSLFRRVKEDNQLMNQYTRFSLGITHRELYHLLIFEPDLCMNNNLWKKLS